MWDVLAFPALLASLVSAAWLVVIAFAQGLRWAAWVAVAGKDDLYVIRQGEACSLSGTCMRSR